MGRVMTKKTSLQRKKFKQIICARAKKNLYTTWGKKKQIHARQKFSTLPSSALAKWYQFVLKLFKIIFWHHKRYKILDFYPPKRYNEHLRPSILGSPSGSHVLQLTPLQVYYLTFFIYNLLSSLRPNKSIIIIIFRRKNRIASRGNSL